jgi:ESS family glutamate:Na+ symporter
MFLGIAMISLKFWELHTLALPLIVILVSQVLMMALFVYWVAFPLLGRDYDAAVLADLINTAVITLFLNLI